MAIVHILRSEPDALTRSLIDRLSSGRMCIEIALYREAVDHDLLLDETMSGERVICWW